MLKKIIHWLNQKYQHNHQSQIIKTVSLILGSLWQWIIIPGLLILIARIIDKHIFIKITHFLPYKSLIVLILFALGIYITYRCISDLSKFGKGSFVPAAGPPKMLVKNGIYKICRNPFYLGQIFILAGLSLIISSISLLLMAIFGIPIFIFYYTKLVEEKVLISQFGQEYLKYKEETPFIFPLRIRTRQKIETRTSRYNKKEKNLPPKKKRK